MSQNVFQGDPQKAINDQIAAQQDRQLAGQGIELNKLRLTDAVEKRNQEIAKARKDAERQTVLHEAFQKNRYEDGQPDFDGIVKTLSSYDPEMAMEWAEKGFDYRQKARQAQIGTLQQSRAELEAAIPILRALRPDDQAAIQAALPELARINPELAQQVATNPASIPTLVSRGLSDAEWTKQQEKLADSYETDPEGSFLHDVSISRNQDDYDDALTALKLHGNKATVERYTRDFGPQWSDQTPQRAVQHALTVKEQLAARQKAEDDKRMAAAAAETARHNAAMERRQTASGGGTGGTSSADSRLVASILKNPSIYGTLTPTVKTRLASALSDAGFDFAAGTGGGGAVKLTAGQQEDIATANDVLGLIDDADALGKKIGWKGVGAGYTGTVSKIAMNFGLGGTSEEEQLRNIIGNINGTIAKARGGTSFTTSEKEMLSQYSPTINDGDERIKAKLISLKTFLTRRKQNILNAATGQTGQAAQTTGEPKRPTGVPANAVWDKAQNLWVVR